MAVASLSLQMKVSLPALGLGLLLFCISFSVTSWASGSYSNVDFHGGLWKVCISGNNYEDCVPWTDDRAKNLAKGEILNVISLNLRVCVVHVCVSAVSYTHLTLPTS